MKVERDLVKNPLKNVLLIQLGDIGDVVWTVPAVSAVKETVPGGKVSILARGDFGELLKADPRIHRVFKTVNSGTIFHKTAANIRLIRQLRAERFDAVFDLRSGDRGAFMSFFTGAPLRGTLDHRDVPFWRNLLFTHVMRPPPLEARVRGASEQTLCLLREFGLRTRNIVPRLWVSDAALTRAKNIIKELNPGERWISINPFSRWKYKEWAPQKWAAVLNKVWEKYRIPVVIVGSADEITNAEELAGFCTGRVRNAAGKTALGELAGLLRLSSCHLGVDSAAPHIAAAVGTPTLTIFGPSDWYDWAPPGGGNRIVVPGHDCVPCYQKGCEGRGWSRCLDELEPEPVFEAVSVHLRELGII